MRVPLLTGRSGHNLSHYPVTAAAVAPMTASPWTYELAALGCMLIVLGLLMR
jgi:hypothetical protein